MRETMRKTAQLQTAPDTTPFSEGPTTTTRPFDASGGKVRSAIGVVVSRFPLVTETFILREIEELERQGQAVRLVPLLKETPDVVHREAEAWVSRALFTPFLSFPILASNLRVFARAPRRYLSLLAEVLVRSSRSWNLFTGTLGIFPKSVYLSERLANEGVSHLHAHFATHPAMAAYIASRLSGMSFSFTAHAHDIFVHRAMLGEKIRRAAFVRCISRFNRDFLSRVVGPSLEDRAHVVHVGVDAAAPPPAGNGKDSTASPLKILCVAAFKHYKGLPVLVETCHRLKERGLPFRCDVIGDGPLRPEIERLIQTKGLEEEIHLLGNQPQHRVRDWMAGASVFVLPSIVAPDGQMEGIPVVLMEAMACERPVIASSLSGIGELIDDGLNGLLVPPGDIVALTEAVVRVAENPNWAGHIGQQGRLKILAEFQLKACVSELLHLIDRFRAPVPGDVEHLLTGSLELHHEANLGLRAVHDGPDSRVFEIILANGKGIRELVYKLHKSRSGQSRPPEERARRELAILSRLDAPRKANDRCLCRAPRPVRLLGEQAAVVMEACPGTPLHLMLRQARLHRPSSLHGPSEMGVRRAALWLRTFQAPNRRSGVGGKVLDDLLHQAGNDLERCIATGLTVSEARLVRERLRAGEDRASLDPPSLCLYHGDFGPGNIFIDGDEARVIDFEGWREGLPLEDVAYFTLQLELFFPFPLLRRLGKRYTAAFLETYIGGETFDADLYRLCRTAKALQILSSRRARSRALSLGERLRTRMLKAACLYG